MKRVKHRSLARHGISRETKGKRCAAPLWKPHREGARGKPRGIPGLLPAIALAAIAFLGSERVSAEDYYPELVTLIAQLANLTAMGTLCEDQLKIYGRDALADEKCTSFENSFFKQWPDRDSLKEEISSIVTLTENGNMPCNERCRSMLLRSEEMRIGIVYILDYMDFVKE